MSVVPWDRLPVTGYFVPGVAAGYMYKADAGLCLIEGYITNPEVDKGIRHAAMNRITATLIREAKEQGFTSILAFTVRDSMIEHAESFGFNNKSVATLLVKGIE